MSGFGRLLILARLALRNVLRYSRRSLLTASAMILGMGLLIFSRTLADGAHESWIDQGVRLGTGHVVIQGEGYLRSGSLDDRLTAEVLGRAEGFVADSTLAVGVVTAAPRLAVPGLASSAGSSAPVQVVGIDPKVEPDFGLLHEKLEEGRYLETDDRLAAFIGQGLAERLGVHLKSRFVLTAQDAEGEIQGQLVRVTGIFRTGVPGIDQGIVQIPIETARSWLGAPGAASSFGILLENSRAAPRLIRETRRRLDDHGVEVLSWRQASPELDAAVKIDDLGDWVFHLITLAIIALAILNAVLMSVLRRHREFGVLQALGLTGRETSWVVLVEGVLLTLLSGVAGLLLGLGVVWAFFRDGLDFSFAMDEDLTFSGTLFDPVMVPEFRTVTIALSFLLIILIGILASVYPAWQARKIDVAESMKFER